MIEGTEQQQMEKRAERGDGGGLTYRPAERARLCLAAPSLRGPPDVTVARFNYSRAYISRRDRSKVQHTQFKTIRAR